VPPVQRASLANTGNGNTEVTVYNDSISFVSFAPSTAQSPQTVTVTIMPPPPTSECHQTFCIAIPPGSGSITITKISLTPGQANRGNFPFPGYRPPPPQR
jgi:hypothetical protein